MAEGEDAEVQAGTAVLTVLAGWAGSAGWRPEAQSGALLQAWVGWRVLDVQRQEEEEVLWSRRNTGGDDGGGDGGGGDDGDVCEVAGPSSCGFLMG